MKRISILIAGILSAPVYADVWSNARIHALEQQQRNLLSDQRRLEQQMISNRHRNNQETQQPIRLQNKQHQPFNTESVWDEEIIAE
jgi:hypothetical protein